MPVCRLQLFGHGSELFAKDEATLAVLQRHLLRSAGAECVDALLRYLAADSAAEEAEEGQGGDPALADASAGPLSAAQRAAVLKELPPDVKPAASAAVEKLGGTSLEVRWLLFLLLMGGSERGGHAGTMAWAEEVRGGS